VYVKFSFCVLLDRTVTTEPCVLALDQFARDGLVDLSFEADVSPGSPGRLSGPWEDSYPPEAPEFFSVNLLGAVVEGKLVEVPKRLAYDFIDYCRDDLLNRALDALDANPSYTSYKKPINDWADGFLDDDLPF